MIFSTNVLPLTLSKSKSRGVETAVLLELPDICFNDNDQVLHPAPVDWVTSPLGSWLADVRLGVPYRALIGRNLVA